MIHLQQHMKESGHWYKKDGTPVFEVPNKSKGGMRPTSLKDAKTLGLLPSVTTYFRCLAKAELENWKMRQVAMAALTFPHSPGEDDQAFIERIIVDAFEQVVDAADLGTQIHKALEQHFQGQPFDPAMQPYVDAVDGLVRSEGIELQQHELRVIGEGYAGTTDAVGLKAGKLCVIDFKSRKTKPGMKCAPWSTEPMQIAAYAKPFAASMGANLYISTTEPGRVDIVWYDEAELQKAWDGFQSVMKVWQHFNGYTPTA